MHNLKIKLPTLKSPILFNPSQSQKIKLKSWIDRLTEVKEL